MIDTVVKVVPTKATPVISTISEIKNTEIKNNKIEVKNDKITETKNNTVPVFKVQLFASKKAVKHNSHEFKGLTNVDCFIENGMNKYTVGSETDFRKIEVIRKQLHSKFPEAFVIAFKGDRKLTVRELSKIIK